MSIYMFSILRFYVLWCNIMDRRYPEMRIRTAKAKNGRLFYVIRTYCDSKGKGSVSTKKGRNRHHSGSPAITAVS